MINRILFSVFTFLLIACNSQTNKESTISVLADSSNVTLTNKKSERFIPETKGIEKFDTLIVDGQIQITITKTYLDSYVTNEYVSKDRKLNDKYRDKEVELTIIQNSQILLDTIFRKEQFSKYAFKGFMDIAIFQNYKFVKLDKDKIELSGDVSKPESNYVLAFNHYFNLRNKSLKFVPLKYDEE